MHWVGLAAYTQKQGGTMYPPAINCFNISPAVIGGSFAWFDVLA